MGLAAIKGKLATEFNERTTETKFCLSSYRLLLQSNGIFAATAKVFPGRKCNKTKKLNIRGRNCVIRIRERIEISNEYQPPPPPRTMVSKVITSLPLIKLRDGILDTNKIPLVMYRIKQDTYNNAEGKNFSPGVELEKRKKHAGIKAPKRQNNPEKQCHATFEAPCSFGLVTRIRKKRHMENLGKCSPNYINIFSSGRVQKDRAA